MKKKYELMVIVRSSILDKEVEERIRTVKELLGNEIVYEERWGVRPFAYRIKKEQKGYYAVFNMLLPPESIFDIEKNLRLMPDILRFMLITVPEDYAPITLKTIEEGLEKLRKEKLEKRTLKGGGAEVPVFREKDVKVKPIEQTKEKHEEPYKVKTEEIKETQKPKVESKPKTFDQKLDDILRDEDLGL